MNKSRRQFAETGRLLVEKGYAVLLVDPFGTGDSEGEFADATWACWKADIVAAMTWMDMNTFILDAVVAARLGCALAAESLRETGRAVSHSVFWQPVENGRRFVTQLLRLRVAASMIESDVRETVDGLRQRLKEGEILEVAGYQLTPAWCRAIEELDLSLLLDDRLGRLALFEVGRSGRNELSAATRNLADAAGKCGLNVMSRCVQGDSFWSSTEVVVNPELAERTAGFLSGAATR